MKKYNKILILGLILAIGIMLLPTVSKADTNIGISKDAIEDLTGKTSMEIINLVIDKDSKKLESEYVDDFIGTYFSSKKSIGNTYKFKIENYLAPPKNDWDFCVEKGTEFDDGFEMIIEKLVAIANRDITTIRYAVPSPLYSNDTESSLIDGSKDNSINYFSKGSSDIKGNYYARWNNKYQKFYFKDSLGEYHMTYYTYKETQAKSAQRAYILSRYLDEDKKSYNSWDEYRKNSIKQVALWQLEGQVAGENSLLQEARKFSSYRENVESNPRETSIISTVSGFQTKFDTSGIAIIGPFKATFDSKFGKINTIKIEYNGTNKLNSLGTKYYTTDSSGNKINITNGNNFYIKIPSSTISEYEINTINKITATFNDTNAYALYSFAIQAGTNPNGEDIQNQIIIHKAQRVNETINSTISLNEQLISPVYIEISKKNTLGNDLSGVKFDITAKQGENIQTFNGMVTSNGKIELNWRPTSTNDIEITIKETAGVEKHQSLNESIELTLKYESNKWKATEKTDKENVVDITNNTAIKLTIKNQFISGIQIGGDTGSGFNKVDGLGNPIPGAKFKAVFEQNGTKLKELYATSDSNGKISFDAVQPTTTAEIKVTLTEESAPVGYANSGFNKTITFTYDGANHKWISNDTTVETKNDNPQNEKPTYVKLKNVENKSAIEKLTILKTDISNNKLQGAKFDIELTNVESIGYYSSGTTSGTIKLSGATTDSNGNLVLEDLVIKDLNGSVIINIKETEAPKGYKKIDGTITVELKRQGDSYTTHTAYKDASISDDEFVAGNIQVTENHEIALNIKNIPVMNIGGVVWEDTQTGDKTVSGPDGKFNNDEQGMAGVEVFLMNADPVFDADGNITNYVERTTTVSEETEITYIGHKGEVTTTLQKGGYLFAGVPKQDNYYVIFKYDGMSYQTVAKGTENNESKVDEIGRDTFNAKFQIIGKDEAISSGIKLYYNTTDNKSELIRDDANVIKKEFVMYAKSDRINSSNWQETWKDDGTANDADSRLHTNCGLTYRFFDLAIGTDVQKATVSINGETVEYGYAELWNNAKNDDPEADKELDLELDLRSSEKDIIYNLYLYASDYNYRIEDYLTDRITNNVNPNPEDVDIPAGDKLKVQATYAVFLKNRSTQNAAVQEFVYYYNGNYTPAFEVGYESSGYKVTSIDTINRKITFTGNEMLTVDNDYRKEVYMTFDVNIDNINPESDNKYTNVAEITKYYTENGIIDVDSAPDNGITNGIITQYEDDTDEAIILNIQVKEDKKRTIRGTVWDDGKKSDPANGQLEGSEPKVNDVIVQLIEIKNISGVYCEYIWQQTKSGSKEVTKVSLENGDLESPITYDDSITIEPGEYLFTDFIPGNYIIRFIYGDGTTYDVTPNVEKYNGQDYQSTIDKNYNVNWYNTAEYEDNDNKARDNEARRLEVMAYSTIIDETVGKELEEKTTLDKTWMAAETPRIYVPVDGNIEETEGTQSASATENGLEFSNVNFGLALRPQTKLTLEKHITGLKITPAGVGSVPIVDAKANIDDILDGTIDNMTGVTDGLATIASNRDNRGFWQVATDVEELAQGANLEVEYTYVIKNESDEDYLSSTLVQQYELLIGKDEKDEGMNENPNNKDDYGDYLMSLIPSVKGAMRSGQYSYSSSSESNIIGKQLGAFYYTGDEEGLTPLTSRADGIEESLNEQFGSQSSVGDHFNAKTATADDLKTYIDTDGRLEGNEKTIVTVLESKNGTDFLKIGDDDKSKTAKITTVLSSVTNGEVGGNFPSYIAEITSYSNAAGRRNMNGTPGNLQYVHSEDTNVTMDSVTYNTAEGLEEAPSKAEVPEGATIYRDANEDDEFWGETIIITKPTGEDKLTIVQIAIIVTASVAVLGAGIILIKKLVLKK